MPTIKVKLTKPFVDGLRFGSQPVLRNGRLSWRKTPAGTHDWFIQDDTTPGLMIRMTADSASWVVRRKLHGKTRRRVMGSTRQGESRYLTITQAKERCEAWRRMMSEDHDPRTVRKQLRAAAAEEQQRQSSTLRKAYADYVEVKRNPKKNPDLTTKDREKVGKWLDRSPLWICPVSDVSGDVVRATFQPMLDAVNNPDIAPPKWGPRKPGSINKMYVYAHKAWLREARRQKLTGDPFEEWRQDVVWPTARRKTRRLETKTNKGQVWIQALVRTWRIGHEREQEAPLTSLLADFYLCVLLWGTRLTETCRLEWSQVDTDKKVLFLLPETTKTTRLGTIPLTPWALEILELRRNANQRWRPDSPWVFPSPRRGQCLSNPRKALDRLAEETGVRISTHDLRRTQASDMGKEARSVEAQALMVAAATLQHEKGSSVTGDYMLTRAEIVRPVYQRREDTLRKIAGLPILGGTDKPAATNNMDAVIERIAADEKLRKQLLAKMLAA